MRLTILLLCGLCAAILWAAPPTTNPLAGVMPDGAPAWTDAVRWDQVIDMSAYAKGATDFEKFEAARDELAAKGGGVLYYPAGTYDFSQGPFDGPTGRGLMLKPGVVIRGEAPKGKLDPTSGKLDLGTKFVFGFTDRSKVAVDTGTRLRLLLRGVPYVREKGAKPVTSDVVLSLGDRLVLFGADDQLEGSVVELPDVRLGGKVTMGTDKDADGKERTFVGATDQGSDYTVELYLKDGVYTGTYTYTGWDGPAAKGPAIGKFTTVKAETPRDWNIIGLCPPEGGRLKDVHNVGICFVHLVGATVYFGPDLSWGPTWKTAGSWKSAFVKEAWADRVPDGTHPSDPFMGGGKEYIGAGSRRLVVGCVLEDGCVVNNHMTCGVTGFKATPEHANGFGPDGFYMAKFPARLAAYGSQVLVAGNVLPKPTRAFKYVQTTTRDQPAGGGSHAFLNTRQSYVLFDPGKTCGIDVNKEMLGLTKESATGAGAPGYFPEDIVVRDNYVWNNGHKGYNLSGTWGVVANNVNDREVLNQGVDPYGVYGWRLTLDGFVEANAGGPGMISDNLARAFDMGGRNMWIDHNRYWNTGSVPGNDGEGILAQAHGGTMLYSWAMTHNTGTHTAPIRGSERGSIWTYDVDILGALWGWNVTQEKIGAWKHKDRQTFDVAFTGNTQGTFGPPPGSYIEATDAPDTIKPPTDVAAEPYKGTAVKIAYKDASDNEVGFRIDRKVGDGPWTVIGYRPPQIQTNADNPPMWIDFTAPSGKALTYRVVAITGKDSDAGASGATAAITIPKP